MDSIYWLSKLLNECNGNWRMKANDGGGDYEDVWYDDYPNGREKLVWEGNKYSWEAYETMNIPKDFIFTEEDYKKAIENKSVTILGKELYYID